MRRRMMKSKIHRATVTDANLDYVGSITLDTELMELADIREYEQVTIVDIDNGARFETYAIAGGRGDVCLNGAAARLVHPGDKIIVITYADYDDADLEAYEPRVVHVDTANRAIDEATARMLAQATPGPIRYVEIQAQVQREMATLDAELGELG
jgi:aspartate 1-decarboxylase